VNCLCPLVLHRVVGFSANPFECYITSQSASQALRSELCLSGHKVSCVLTRLERDCVDNAVGSGKTVLLIDKYRENTILWDPREYVEHTRTQSSLVFEMSIRCSSISVV
jgi:hypothetical protein